MLPFVFFALMARVGALLLPEPSGPHSVAMTIQAMTDNSRLDPYAPANDQHKRKLLTSVFWPVQGHCSSTEAPYMPPATAKFYGQQAGAMGLSNDTFSSLTFSLCKQNTTAAATKQCKSPHSFPLAIFSPGSGNSRLLYSLLARSLASRGYVVVTVDHPYDASLVEFPDGSIIEAADIPEETAPLEKLTKVRADDITFVLSQLKDLSKSSWARGANGPNVDFSKAVVFGHSLGGASAASVLSTNPDLLAGADLDGQLFNPVLSQGLNKPFFLLGRPNHRKEDETWVQFYKNLRGSKAEASINGTVHGSYTDMPVVIGALGLPKEAMDQAASIVGTIEPKRLEKVRGQLLDSFFGNTLSGSPKKFLKDLKSFPEVSIVNEAIKSKN